MGLELKNITKKYGDKTVVNNISFKMDKPGVYALLGRNGAGKTTTIRIMLKMLASNSGEVLWNGKDLDPIDTQVGYLAEERGLYPKYTLMDQLVYFGKLKGLKEKEAKKRIKYWSEKLEVSQYLYPEAKGKKKPLSMKADQLSKGNQQKIQLMAALISDPEIIVLDEPLSGLDPVNAEIFKNIIKECIAKNKYIIMSSHQMSIIEEFCSDILILDKGVTVLQGNLNEIKKSYGRVNLFIKCEEDISKYLKLYNLDVKETTPEGFYIKVHNENESKQLLQKLVEDNVTIIKYELREPSLNEIFIEKAGGYNE